MDKPCSFYIQNLRENNLKLSNNQIKWILQKIRQNKYPKNEDFLKDNPKITLTYENIVNMENFPKCYKYANVINPEKKFCLEKYIIFYIHLKISIEYYD